MPAEALKITLVTTMRNEAPHLLEWIAHHLAAGVSDFLVYSNDCRDGTRRLLDALPCVTHVPQDVGEKPPQWQALRDAWDHPLVENADWVMCIDCDEFINLNKDLSGIADLIERANADAIILPWRLYGHNGQADLSDAPTTERFTRAAPEQMIYPAIGSYFKTLFRKDGPFRQLGVHRPRQKNPERHGQPKWVNGSGHALAGPLVENDGQIMNWGAPIARDLVQLNHYSTRSAAEFLIKRDRGLPNHVAKKVDLTYWVERNFNTVEDASIAHMGQATREVLAGFMEIEAVATAYRDGMRWHKARFAKLMEDAEALRLYGRLLLAAGSTPPDDKTALGLIRTYQAIHAKG